MRVFPSNRCLAIFFVVVLLFSFGCTLEPEQDFEEITSILFIRSGDIWTWNPSGEKKLTDFGDVKAVEMSADGSKLAIWRDNAQLWLANANGSDAELLDEMVWPTWGSDRLRHSWHPFENKIVYSSWHWTICIRDVVTGDFQEFDPQGSLWSGPWWHPNGKAVFMTTRYGTKCHLTTLGTDGNLFSNSTISSITQPFWSKSGMIFLEESSSVLDEGVWISGLGLFNNLGYRSLYQNDMDRGKLSVSSTGIYAALFTGEGLAIIDLENEAWQTVIEPQEFSQQTLIDYYYVIRFAWSLDDRLASLKILPNGNWELNITEPGKETSRVMEINFQVPTGPNPAISWSDDGNLVYLLEEVKPGELNLWQICLTSGSLDLLIEDVDGLPIPQRRIQPTSQLVRG